MDDKSADKRQKNEHETHLHGMRSTIDKIAQENIPGRRKIYAEFPQGTRKEIQILVASVQITWQIRNHQQEHDKKREYRNKDRMEMK